MLREILIIIVFILLPLQVWAACTDQGSPYTYYVSDGGSGNCLSSGTPGSFSDVWSVVGPGDTVIALDGDGVYTGSANMILPPAGLNRSNGSPITISAETDGGILLDGQDTYNTVHLTGNDWWVIEGFNATDSYNQAVYRISSGSDNNIIRRCIGWDAPPDPGAGGHGIFSTSGANTLFEDCAGFGQARKTFSSSQAGVDSNNTFRRCWGRWEQYATIGPKMTLTMEYNNEGLLVENGIFSIDPQANTDQDNFGVVSYDTTVYGNGSLLGSIVYIENGTTLYQWDDGIQLGAIPNFTLKNVAVYIGTTVSLTGYSI